MGGRVGVVRYNQSVMKQALITMLVVLMMALQTNCNTLEMHDEANVVANLLSAPFYTVLLSVLCILISLM